MTSDAAHTAANDDSARGATRTPSVEQFNESLQIGTLMHIVPKDTDTPQPLTAAQRGPEWTARYGCTPICAMDHAGGDGEPGWHAGPITEVMAPARFAYQPSDAPILPLLSTRVVTVNQDAAIFGIETRAWVETGDETMELDVDEMGQLLDTLENALPRLRAVHEQLREQSEGDRPENPALKAEYMARDSARRKTITNCDREQSAVSEAHAIADQSVNKLIAREHPYLAAGMLPTWICTYCHGPATTVRTGRLGNRYGLCVGCASAEGRSIAAEQVNA